MDPLDLPIHRHADEILAAMASHALVIVQGETGCGKTTQLPQLCLKAGRVSAPKLERAASQWKVRAIHASSGHA